MLSSAPVSGAAKAALAAAMSRMVSSFLNLRLDLTTFVTDLEPATVTCSQEVSDELGWAPDSGGAAFFGALFLAGLAFTASPDRQQTGFQSEW